MARSHKEKFDMVRKLNVFICPIFFIFAFGSAVCQAQMGVHGNPKHVNKMVTDSNHSVLWANTKSVLVKATNVHILSHNYTDYYRNVSSLGDHVSFDEDESGNCVEDSKKQWFEQGHATEAQLECIRKTFSINSLLMPVFRTECERVADGRQILEVNYVDSYLTHTAESYHMTPSLYTFSALCTYVR